MPASFPVKKVLTLLIYSVYETDNWCDHLKEVTKINE